MAMNCDKCGGIIPDVVFGGKSRNDCKNHIKPDYDVDYVDPRKRRGFE